MKYLLNSPQVEKFNGLNHEDDCINTFPMENGINGDTEREDNIEKGRSSSKSALLSGFLRRNAARKQALSHVAAEFFEKHECPYTHQVFKYASLVYEALKMEEKDDNPYRRRQDEDTSNKVVKVPHIEFADDREQRLTFTLAFNALKYQKLLEAIVEDCAFFGVYPELKEDMNTAMVMLCDFQQRRFQPRKPVPDEITDPQVQEIEDAIHASKTKLNASLARTRVKAQAPAVEYLLPEKVRLKEQARKCDTVLYAWVNFFKSSVEAMMDRLIDEGFEETGIDQVTGSDEAYFAVDQHCSDLLVFPACHREFLMEHELAQEGHLIIQDKSSSLGPHSAKALMDDGDDIIHVNLGSGLTTAHLASLCCNSSTTVFAFGIQNEMHYQKVKTRMDHLGVRGVRVLPENFTDIPHTDTRFKNTRTILISAECSKSGVPDPVEFIVNEGEGAEILKDLATGEMDQTKLAGLVNKHLQVLKHAFRFPRVQGIVFCTRSMYDAENETVIARAVEYSSTIPLQKSLNMMPFRITPPVLPLTEDDIEREIVKGKFLQFPPASGMSGCFISIITREMEDPKEATKDILARAAAKGLLGNKPEKKATRLEKARGDALPQDYEDPGKRTRKRSPHRSKSQSAKPSTAGVSMVPKRRTHAKRSLVSARLLADPRTRSHEGSLPSMAKANEPPHVKVVKHPAPFR